MKGYLLIHVIPICIALASLTLAGIVLTARQHRAEHWWMAALAIAAGLWGIGVNIFLLVTSNVQLAEAAAHFYYIVAAAIPLCLVGLAINFPVKHKWSPVGHIALATGFVLALTISLAPGGLIQSVTLSNTGNEVVFNRVYYDLYVTYFLSFVAISVTLFFKSYRLLKHKKQQRSQLKSMLSGMFIALIFGSFFNLILPLLGDYSRIWAGPPFTILFVVATFYAIIQQKLFDLRATLARTTAYFLLLFSLVAAYGIIIFGITNLFFIGKTVNDTYATILVMVALGVTFTYAPLKRLIDHQTHKYFYRDEYNMSEVSQQLSDITAREMELRSLVKRSLELLDDTFSPEYIVAYVTGNDGRLHHFSGGMEHITPHVRKVQLDIMEMMLDNMPRVVDAHQITGLSNSAQHMIKSGNSSMILQFVVQQERVGALFIGDKQNGRPYDERDLQLLSTAADELALAIQNSLRFAEIQHFNDTLKDKVADATKKLRKTNRELQKLDEAKDEFVSMASHQLRTPLTSIKGYISMVMEGDAGKITEQQKQLLNEAFISSERMVHLIADFLSVSRLQTGKFIIDTTPIDMDAMIYHDLVNMRAIAESHGQKLDYSAPVKKQVAHIDEQKIQQVIMNFIDNAIYYSRPNSTINVSLEYTKNEVIFMVKDTGIGVPEAEQEKLFTKFFRATNARKQRPDGTGVGLYLAKRIISAHGGAMLFTSKEGQGSMFGFRLPLK